MVNKKVVEVIKDEKETIIEETPSQRKEAFKALIKAYKEQNPKKYEEKKEALKVKLETL